MKKIRKFLPLSIYDIPGIEHWLEEQANAGLFPVYLNSWATFEPIGIPGTRFRLEPWGKEGTSPTEEQMELMHEAGWEYAFTIGQVYFLFYTTDPQAPDLYTDFESRGLSLERLEKRVRRNRRFWAIIWSVLGLLLVWALFFHQSKYDVQPDRFAILPLLLLELFNPIILFFLIAAFFSWKHNRRDRRILEKTCRALKEGLPPPPSAGPSPALAREQKIALILFPFFWRHGSFSLWAIMDSLPFLWRTSPDPMYLFKHWSRSILFPPRRYSGTLPSTRMKTGLKITYLSSLLFGIPSHRMGTRLQKVTMKDILLIPKVGNTATRQA